MNRTLRLIATLLGLAFTASQAGAYYHFYHYTSRNAPYNPIPEKFDLNALPNRTVSVFVSDTTAGAISRPDQYPSVLNAIRQAANMWSSAPSSALRVAFGGVATSGTPQNTPGIDVQFVEMDPLTLGYTVTNAPTVVSGGSFVALQRPLMQLNNNLNNWNSPSFAEGFFLTVAHEMGHALGLQHTWTSSLMSTDATRATSLYNPLTPDDIAGIAFLYPAGNFAQTMGSIAGRVTFTNGQGIHLASVVAITPSGPAISALTLPDGTFLITGVPPGQYMLYAHPVPPPIGSQSTPGDLHLPLNADGSVTAASGPFDTMFYTGGSPTFQYSQAQLVNVSPGGVTNNINFSLNRRVAYTISTVSTYSYFNANTILVKPGYLNGGGTLVAAGAGLTSNGLLAPGLNVSFLGGTPVLDPSVPNNGMQAYAGTYLALYLQATSTFGGSGPRNVIFSLPDDIYVLPAGLNLVQSPPPSISSVTPGFESNGSRSLTLSGSSLNTNTQFFLDSVAAPVLRIDGSGRPVVSLPPGIGGARAIVTAFNSDGQNSMFLQANSPPTYTYDTGAAGSGTLPTNTVQAGTVSMIEIDGTNGNFVDGQTTVGIGSSDAQVLRTWVVAPNKLYANIQVSGNAAPTAATVTALTGSQVVTLPFAVQVLGGGAQVPFLNPQLTNTAPAQSGNYPAAVVALAGSNLQNPTITLNGQPIQPVSANPNQITFQIPANAATGPAILKFSGNAGTVSIVVQIDSAPPGVLGVSGTDNISISSTHPARAGDTLNVLVSSLAAPGAQPDSTQVRVSVGGIDHPAQSVIPQGAGHQVQIVLSPAVSAGQAAVMVTTQGRTSLPYFISVAR